MDEKLEWMKAHVALPPKEALALAHKTWPDMRLGYIYALRSLLRKGGMNIPEASRQTSPTTRVKRRSGHRPISPNTKFVLEQSADVPPDEVVALAKKAGLTITKGAVQTARLRHKSKLVNAVTKRVAAQLAIPDVQAGVVHKTRKPEPVVLPLGTLSEDEADFMGMALNLGWSRASRLLAQFRVQFFGMIKTHANTSEE